MKLSARVITPLVKLILSFLCKLDVREIYRIPRKGPFIVAVNHINFLEVPLIYTHLFPRDIQGIIKVETWNNPLMAFLAGVWNAIPLNRQTTDLTAMRLCLEALAAGRILILAPEGTRSRTGSLQRGHAGIVQIALRSNATIIPVAHFGGERFWPNVKSLRRTRFTFRVGQSFRLNAQELISRQTRTEMADEIMNRISLLLPPSYRGEYPEPEAQKPKHLVFTKE